MILQSMFTKIVFGKCPVKILATRNNLSMISSYKNMSVMSAYRTRLADYKGLTFERTTNLKSHHIRYTCDPFSHTIHLFFTQFIDPSGKTLVRLRMLHPPYSGNNL